MLGLFLVKGENMYIRTINYEDFDGNKCSDDFYFHYSKPDLSKLAVSMPGGIAEYAKKVMSERNGQKMIALYEELILGAVGERRNEGKTFVKNAEIRDNFRFSNAYNVLFEELSTDPLKFAEFFNNVIPSDSKISDAELKKLVDEAQASVN